MSDLGFLKKLLDGASMEWVPLGQLVDTVTAPSKAQRSQYLEVGEIPIVDQGVSFVAGFADDGFEPVKCDEYVIFGDHSEHIKFVDFAFVQGADGLKILRPKSDVPKYVYHALLNFYQKERSYKRHWSKGKETLLPIPCPKDPEKSLAIQAEIVRILDAFSELTAELTAELEVRKKQYNHYREQLLSFEDGEVKNLPMGDERVGKFIRGGGLQKKDFVEAGVGCIHYGQVYTHYGTYAHTTKSYVSEEFAKKARMAKKGDVVIATTSENDEDVCKAVAWLGDNNIAVSSDACFYSHKLNPKFVAYFFQTEQFQKQKRIHITGAKVRRVNADSLAKILIPVPSPEEQDRIVAILDKFDTLTTSLSAGLPREIKLRQQQYEYYRDLLLSFPKPAPEAGEAA